MYILMHLLVAAYCAFEVASSLRNPRGQFARIIMIGGIGVIHGVVPALTPRNLWWYTATNNTIQITAILTLLGVVLFGMSWRLLEARGRDWHGLSPGMYAFIESAAGQRVLGRLFWTALILGMAGWIGSLIFEAGSVSAAFSAGRFEFRGRGNVYGAVLGVHLGSLLAIVPFICFFLPIRHRVLGITVTLAMTILYFWVSKGARTIPLGLLGALMLGYALRQRLSISRLMLVAGVGVVILFLAVGLYEVRKIMAYSSVHAIVSMLFSPRTYEGALVRDPLNYHQFFVAAVQHFPQDHPFLNGATYQRLFVFFLPQRYFPFLKPEDTHNTFAKAILGSGMSEVTIPPTMLGDGYINFWGAPGIVIVMILNGLLFAYATRRMRENLLWFVLVGPAFVRFSLLAVRGSPYEILTSVISSFVFLSVFSLVIGLRFRDRQRAISRYDKEIVRQERLAGPGRRRIRPPRPGAAMAASRAARPYLE